MSKRPGTGYLAAAGFLSQLTSELSAITAVHDHLVLTEGPPQPCVWAENIWYDPELIAAPSIGAAVAALTKRQRNWWPYAWQLHRRHALIQQQLPFVAAKPLAFPTLPKAAPLGSFTLLDAKTMLVAPHCRSPFPNGAVAFREDTEPPSRAYLKLWEALTHLGVWPQPGARCLDLGASPGGWTWVLAKLGAQVIAYDRAALAPHVTALPGVSTVAGDAFSATPERVGRIDWLCSDVICYPERLRDHVRLWLASGLCQNFVCTLKFQGDGHYGVIAEMLQIPGSQVVHLHHNKHELTWLRTAPKL